LRTNNYNDVIAHQLVGIAANFEPTLRRIVKVVI